MAKVVWSERRRSVDSGVFRVAFEQPESVERGHAARFQAMFEHVNDGLVDPASPALKIYEGSTLQAALTPTKDSVGVYFSDYSVPGAAGTGPWVAEWSGTYVGLSILVRGLFRVVRRLE